MNILLNGKIIDAPQGTLQALRNAFYPGIENLVVILNGFQSPNDAKLNEGDEVVVIEKGKLPPREDLERMMMARHTPGVHEKVKKARVAVAGLGGLGSNIATSLARTGIGCLHLVDFDIVEPSNLNRQQYGIRHLGLPKTEALKQSIGEINPFVEVVTDCVRVTEENAASLFLDDDLICEAFDSAAAKALLVNALLIEFPKKFLVAASGLAGYESSNDIRTRKVSERFYLCGDGKTDARAGRGLMAPRVAVCAAHQANMALRLLLGELEA
ncbi:MAG: sulfur carrier protein ThiS adenylyltransferase ThiF [Candidatus Accumulibacter sp.]|nr:sulfur carrier protein ThiS adenylyltransferase ThiF [Accumulibacter sp.]